MAVLVLSASALCGAWADCPAACECKWRSGKESAICAGANLTAVPRHLDVSTQLLDMTGNPLYRVGRDAFADAGLLNLQKLYLSRCRLKAVDRYAFRGLSNLVELDLSDNSIPVVPSAVLESVPELRELRLNGNPIMKVPNRAFEHVPRLVRLDVSGCRVALLESNAFAGLERSLEWLRLDNNQLREVKPSTVVTLARMQGVQLHDNPWNCSCKLRPLREWMVRRNVPYGAPPVCKTPARLARVAWDKLDLDDFACEPRPVPVAPVVVVTEGDNATVSCRMFGMPVPSSRWTRDDRPLGPDGRSVPVTEGRYTNLTIVAVAAQDGGSYACELENRSGSSRANVTVVVVKRSPRLVLAADRYALPGLIVGVILVLSLCLIFLCALAIRTKGSPPHHVDQGTGTTADPFDRYEKIEMDHGDHVKAVAATADTATASAMTTSAAAATTAAADDDHDDDNGCSHRTPRNRRLQPSVPVPRDDGRPDPSPPVHGDGPAAGKATGQQRSGRVTRDYDYDEDGLPPFDQPQSANAPSATDRPTARPSHPTTTVPHR